MDLDMILEQLQMTATTSVEIVFKVRWLRWWKSYEHVPRFSMVSMENVNEKELEKWSVKATFGAHGVPCPFIYSILRFM